MDIIKGVMWIGNKEKGCKEGIEGIGDNYRY
jgi:hypothetical protein